MRRSCQSGPSLGKPEDFNMNIKNCLNVYVETQITFLLKIPTLPNLLESISEIGDGLFLRRLFGRVEENIKLWLVHCSAGTFAGKLKNIILLSISTFFNLFGGRV